MFYLNLSWSKEIQNAKEKGEMKVARVWRHEIDSQVYLVTISTLQTTSTIIIMSKELMRKYSQNYENPI